MDHTSEVAVGIARSPREALSNALRKMSSPPMAPPTIQRIILKPSIYDPTLPGNTSLDLMRALVLTFRSAGGVHVVESDNPLRGAMSAFSKSGYDSLKSLGARLVNLSALPVESVAIDGEQIKQVSLPTPVIRNRFLVNVPTLKRDSRITIGAGIKNLFGLIPERDKAQYHENLEEVLLGLLTTTRPDFTVLDLTDVVVGEREDKKTIHVGGVLVGTDPVAIDAIGATLFGLDPLNIPLLRKAHDLGLGEALPDRIRLVGTEHQKARLSEAAEALSQIEK